MILSVLSKLRKELILLSFCIIFSVALIIITLTKLHATNQNIFQSRQSLLSAKQHYYTSVQNKNLLDKYEPLFIDLHKKYFFNHEARLNWLDSINKIRKKINIPAFTYQLNKQQKPSSPNLKKSYPGIQVYVSTMILNMQLLHEGDLYRLINALDSTAVGLFNIRKCTLIRNKKNQEISLNVLPKKNIISCLCEIDWYTLELEKLVSHHD